MVYDLIREGARAYIGATGFSYGSPNNLHKCTWGERLIQHFFNRLVLPPGGNSMVIGKALAEAKTDYVFGFGTNDALDRKTVTEFNLYGVPWTFVFYPGVAAAEPTAVQPQLRAWTTAYGPVESPAVAGVYARNVEVTISGYDVASENQGGVEYDLFSIPGGDTAIADGAPILPYLEGYSLTLPFSGTVTAVEILDVTSTDIGAHEVPIARVQPWSEGGVSYTTETELAAPFPADLVQYQQAGEGFLFTVFPIQHNPKTNQTTFHSRFLIKVVYSSPLAVAALELTTNKLIYRPGEPIQSVTTVENVGNTLANLTAKLEIQDEFGAVLGSQDSGSFAVAAGGSYALPLNWTGALSGGSYQAVVTLWSGGDLVGGISSSFSVAAGEIVDFTVPALVLPQAETTFSLTFANYRPEPVVATVAIALYDGEKTLVGELPASSLTVGGNSTATANVKGNVTGAAGELYTALARVSVGGEVEGERAAEFTLAHALYLPSVQRNQ
jgi:hypothetical protein